jgi:ABC-2 type transport system permease protein
MRKLWAVIKREYLERVRTRWFLIATVFGPVFLSLVLFLPAYMASREQASADVARIRILDVTGTELGRRVATELNGGLFGDTSRTGVSAVDAAGLVEAESLATRAVFRRQIRGYLVLDAGTLAGRGARYAGYNATALADMRRIENVVSRELLALELRRAGLTPTDAERIKRHRFTMRTERLSPSGRGGSGRVNILFAITVGMLLYMTILMYGQNVLRGVIEEKQTRVAEVVVSSVQPTTLLAGKVLGVGAVGLTQMLAWMAATLLMIEYRVPVLRRLGLEVTPLQLPSITAGMLAVLLVFFLLGYTFYSALFAAVGAMVSSEHEAQQAQMPVVLMLVLTIMFLQPVLSAPDSNLAATLAFIPVSSPIVMPLRMSTVEVPPWEIAISLIALISACYLAVYVAARIYRIGLLLYGKPASVREVARWMRHAR